MGFKEENIFGSSLEALGGGAASTAAGMSLATALGSNPIGWAVGLALGIGAGASSLLGYKKKRQLRRLYKKQKELAGEDYLATKQGLAIKHALAKRATRGGQQGIGGGHDIRGVSIQKDPVTGMAMAGAGPASSVAGIAQGRQKVLSQLEREKAEREWERVRLNLKMARKSKSGMRGALSNFVAGNLQLILGGAFDDMGGGGVGDQTVDWSKGVQGPQPKYTGQSAWTPSYQP